MTEHHVTGEIGLVTGAAGNIGRAIALELVRRGASLALADHPSASMQLEAVAAECRAVDGRARVHPVTFDVTNETATYCATCLSSVVWTTSKRLSVGWTNRT